MRLRALGFALLVSLAACPPPSTACRPETCAGCCDEAARCIETPTAATCGLGGAQCLACGATEMCSPAGSCVAATPDGGGAERRLSYVTRYGWDGDGGTTSALAFDTTTAGAWLRRPEGLAFLPGLVSESGTVVVGGVPPGPVLFQLDERLFIVTDARETLLENVIGGRLGAERPDASTPVTFDVTGLVPADGGHRIRAFFTHDREALGLEARAMPPLSQGGTTFSATVDWTRENGGRLSLPAADQGDRGWFVQLLEDTPDGGLLDRRLVAAGEFPPVSLTSGSAERLTTSVTPAAIEPVPLDIDTAAYRSLAVQFGNRPVAGTSFVVGITVTPGPTRSALTPLTTHVLRVPETRPFPASIALGAPFPPSWSTLFDFRYQPSFVRRSTSFLGGTRIIEPLAQARGRRLAPTLSAPRDANVSGRRIEFDVSAITTTPTVSWTEPSIGTPSWYRLRWFPMTGPANQPPTVFWTKATRLEMPPTVLRTGDAYVLELTAVSTGDGQPGITLPLAESVFVSGVLTP